jgi:hypothetical protein
MNKTKKRAVFVFSIIILSRLCNVFGLISTAEQSETLSYTYVKIIFVIRTSQ